MNSKAGRAKALPAQNNTKQMKRKSKSTEGSTQRLYTFRIDNENDKWLDEQSEQQEVAKGRLLNNIISQARDNSTPSATTWQQTRKALMSIREQLKQAVIDMYNALDKQSDYYLHDEDEQPDTYTNYKDKQP